MPLWVAVILLGVIEGITEFLPVSSTGHLLIAEQWLGLNQSDLFTIVIQSGAVLAVLPLFPDRLHQFCFRWRERQTQDYLLKIFVAFAITGIGGVLMEKGGFKLPDKPGPIAAALFIGGLGFVLVERWLKGRELKSEVSWGIVLAVGAGQLVAAGFPGTSRSGATILAALLLGLNRVAATEFTFLVGIPTMLAAGGLKIFKELSHTASGPSENWGMVVLGFVTAAVVSFIAVKWLLRYVQTHTFTVFGWYRIGLAAVIVLLLAASPPAERPQAGTGTNLLNPASLPK
jgi:undecaprenyl-diphosphatase